MKRNKPMHAIKIGGQFSVNMLMIKKIGRTNLFHPFFVGPYIAKSNSKFQRIVYPWWKIFRTKTW